MLDVSCSRYGLIWFNKKTRQAGVKNSGSKDDKQTHWLHPPLSSFFEELPGVGNSLAEMAPLLWMKHHCNFSSSPHPLYQQMSLFVVLLSSTLPRCLRPQLSRSWRSYRTSGIWHLHRFRLVNRSFSRKDCTRDVYQCLSSPWLLLHSDVLCLSSARTSCSFL